MLLWQTIRVFPQPAKPLRLVSNRPESGVYRNLSVMWAVLTDIGHGKNVKQNREWLVEQIDELVLRRAKRPISIISSRAEPNASSGARHIGAVKTARVQLPSVVYSQGKLLGCAGGVGGVSQGAFVKSKNSDISI
jgi:hypothetical protein